jgi:hypothetical protein|tara:strand:- start:78 stop:716 length:639 start_codon:yes stop_codon:yes gene_type:complete
MKAAYNDAPPLGNKVSLQLYTFEHPLTHSHSFLVASHKGGMTTSLAIIKIDEHEDCLQDFRLRIETQKDRGMVRRTLVFSEILQSMNGSVNWHSYPRDIALFAYQFGLVRRDDPTGAPSVIPLEDEVLPLNKVLSAGDPTSLPVLVIVPVSQICPVRQQCHSDVVVQFSEGNDEDLDEDGEPDELMGDKRGTLTEDQIDALFSKIRAHAVSK